MYLEEDFLIRIENGDIVKQNSPTELLSYMIYYVIWNHALYLIFLPKSATIADVKIRIVDVTGVSPKHPNIKFLKIDGNIPYIDTELLLNLSENLTMFLANMEISKSNDKQINVLLHFNSKLFVIIIHNSSTIEKLLMDVSKATSLAKNHHVLQNMSINGNLLRNFTFVSDLQLSMETHTYLEYTPMYFTTDHPLTSKPYIYGTIIFDKIYEIIVPNYITIGLLKQAIAYYTGIRAANRCLVNLSIDGSLAVNDYLILAEFTSNSAFTINLNETLLNLTRSSHTLKSNESKPPITFTIISKRQSYSIIMERNKTIQDLMEEINRITEVPFLNADEMNYLIINGMVKYKYDVLATIPNDFITISLDRTANEAGTSTTKLHAHTYIKKAKEYVVPFTRDEIKDIYEEVETLAKKYQAIHLHSLDPKKKLLVLDLDHTLFDFPSEGILTDSVIRPHLLEFLTTVYVHYNVIIWSATSMNVILFKLNKLALDNQEGFKFSALVDKEAMTTVNVTETQKRMVKPLMLIWNLFKEYDERNTIMLDDLSTNFILNPRSGIVVKPYLSKNFKTDNELQKLKNYLKNIAINSKDFTQEKLRQWETSDVG